MTAQPHQPEEPERAPYTVAEYEALGEEDDRMRVRYELQEGSIVMSPSPKYRHNRKALRLVRQLLAQIPDGLEVNTDVDVDLELNPPDEPGFVRRPDIIVVPYDTAERLDESDEMTKASDVVLVVEIISPGSKRMDNVVKRGEYADAGIPYYWIVDLDPPVSLVACHRTEEFGYQDSGAVTGEFRTTEPFDVRIDLTKLG